MTESTSLHPARVQRVDCTQFASRGATPTFCNQSPIEARVEELELIVEALTKELRLHSHNSFSGEYGVLFPHRTEIAALRGTNGSEMALR